MNIDVLKIFSPSLIAFFVGLLLAPSFNHYFYKYKMWKKKSGKMALGEDAETPIFNKMHAVRDSGTPRLGGMVIWIVTLLVTFVFAIVPDLFETPATLKLDFLSRNQTWLPLFTLITASLLGLMDDLLLIKNGRGLHLRTRILFVLLIGAMGGWWFYTKLEVSALAFPIFGIVEIGAWIVPLFMLVMLAIFSGGVIDGIDGLAGGIMATIFSAYTLIAFLQNQIDLAAFLGVITGGILAFLWFNIPPAKFYMGESGMLGLTAAISVAAFLTDAVSELFIIALPLFIASGSDIIQIASKRLRGKKVFLVAPIHHHFEAIGWPAPKVTMRFWIVGVVSAVIGVVVALLR